MERGELRVLRTLCGENPVAGNPVILGIFDYVAHDDELAYVRMGRRS